MSNVSFTPGKQKLSKKSDFHDDYEDDNYSKSSKDKKQKYKKKKSKFDSLDQDKSYNDESWGF